MVFKGRFDLIVWPHQNLQVLSWVTVRCGVVFRAWRVDAVGTVGHGWQGTWPWAPGHGECAPLGNRWPQQAALLSSIISCVPLLSHNTKCQKEKSRPILSSVTLLPFCSSSWTQRWSLRESATDDGEEISACITVRSGSPRGRPFPIPRVPLSPGRQPSFVPAEDDRLPVETHGPAGALQML